MSKATRAVVGVTLLTRPIKPPGAITAEPSLTPCRLPLPSSSCCHQPDVLREITGAEMLVPRVLSS